MFELTPEMIEDLLRQRAARQRRLRGPDGPVHPSLLPKPRPLSIDRKPRPIPSLIACPNNEEHLIGIGELCPICAWRDVTNAA